ncbi:copper homeostasis periplasmic binding protein CopC [Bradyrhizobium sp. ISRA443]|uniref:copper homeostasis periplasmic binding protein CopC n=1 Tax=unclassified Bradyrhizobium TaxID=2631580 RepID=UPI002479CA05|nr:MULTISPECIES: copper homeostasis periplasmic binding protein CopC [unclassified Bradyrhizobium]WGS00112.1 copper homeostasis periplasmic binding protein CopC [Bradyrhizobium sp. ISRA436]WGS07001.1 copper homeostasis periplasmic binding protein CopC [Bradyrhizobium sp. ISRA437]WGS13883.1 copper homeostasis periplasmic binding protein CopC [Bradyrhizobium sp. ISRA443]
MWQPKLSVGALALAMIGVMTLPACAHPLLKSASPAANDRSTSSPSQIELNFSEGVIAKFSGLELKDDQGKTVATGAATTDPKDKKHLIVPVSAPLAQGHYTVNWHAVSEDTHRVQGQYTFSVGR